MLSPKTLKYLRLTHRYVSFICAGILFVYLLSGFLLNHRKEFTFMNQKKERTVDYIFQLPANKDDFTEADARKIISDLSCNPDLYNRWQRAIGNQVGCNQPAGIYQRNASSRFPNRIE